MKQPPSILKLNALCPSRRKYKIFSPHDITCKYSKSLIFFLFWSHMSNQWRTIKIKDAFLHSVFILYIIIELLQLDSLRRKNQIIFSLHHLLNKQKYHILHSWIYFGPEICQSLVDYSYNLSNYFIEQEYERLTQECQEAVGQSI